MEYSANRTKFIQTVTISNRSTKVVCPVSAHFQWWTSCNGSARFQFNAEHKKPVGSPTLEWMESKCQVAINTSYATETFFFLLVFRFDQINKKKPESNHNRQATTSFCIVNVTWIIWILFSYPQESSGLIGVYLVGISEWLMVGKEQLKWQINMELGQHSFESLTEKSSENVQYKFDLIPELWTFRNV